MPSDALREWETVRLVRLDEIEDAHAAVGGVLRGRRFTTQQVNNAYITTLSAQFQGFCRDLHSEAAIFVASQVQPALLILVAGSLQEDRQIDRHNAQPSSLGADFGRFGMEFWSTMAVRDQRNRVRQNRLEQLVVWRNRIVHERDFNDREEQIAANTTPTLVWARRWRGACKQLAVHFDGGVADHLEKLVQQRPW